jgi:glucose-6-phosphate 1-dehydrogenase
MAANSRLEPAIIVIFGARSDLTRRKLIPALYNLHLDGWLPDQFAIIGVNRSATTLEEFRSSLRSGVDEFSRRGSTDTSTWESFAERIAFLSLNFDDPVGYKTLSDQISALEKSWGKPTTRVFYQATPPATVAAIIPQLGKAGLARDRERDRIVLEKPFGHDLKSARELDRQLTGVFHESQVYRIDHYLGKETVQNILAFRFANIMFEPIWSRSHIDHVQLTVAEQEGVGHRGDYYEHSGALRDMIQNHILQLMCLIAMEPPVSFDADEIRNKKVDVLRAIRPIPGGDITRSAVRGQYGRGWIRGSRAAAYRAETGVSPESNTETFVAAKFFVDNWRWQDVPFYLRTGKRLPTKSSEITIQFRPVPHQSFPASTVTAWHPNRLIIRLQPAEGIALRFLVKEPGPMMRLNQEELHFHYADAFKTATPEAYETLLLDVLRGDATLFMRADQVECAWSVVTPILEVWDNTEPLYFPNYPAGTWGPEVAESLIAQDGRHWLQPIVPDEDSDEPTGGPKKSDTPK